MACMVLQPRKPATPIAEKRPWNGIFGSQEERDGPIGMHERAYHCPGTPYQHGLHVNLALTAASTTPPFLLSSQRFMAG